MPGIFERPAITFQGAICRLCCCALLTLAAGKTSSQGGTPFLRDLTLQDGRVVVVEESALEPRSIGSFSIRLYSGSNPDFPFDDFISGMVTPRNGYVERLVLEDIDDDGHPEVIVVLRSVGSGSYQSARAFSIEENSVNLVAEVDNLPPAEDPIERLRR